MKKRDESKFDGFSIEERKFKGGKDLCAVFSMAYHRRHLVNHCFKTLEVFNQSALEARVKHLPSRGEDVSWERDALFHLIKAKQAKAVRSLTPQNK